MFPETLLRVQCTFVKDKNLIMSFSLLVRCLEYNIKLVNTIRHYIRIILKIKFVC